MKEGLGMSTPSPEEKPKEKKGGLGLVELAKQVGKAMLKAGEVGPGTLPGAGGSKHESHE